MTLRSRIEALEARIKPPRPSLSPELLELVRHRMRELMKRVYGPDWEPSPPLDPPLSPEEHQRVLRECLDALRRRADPVSASSVETATDGDGPQ